MLPICKFMIIAILTSVTLGACTIDRNLASDNTSVAQIRSTKDLQVYLQTTPNSPLNYLSPAVKQHFVSNLIFSENGLGSYPYTDLKDLSATQIYQILSLFGTEDASSMITKENIPSNLLPGGGGGGGGCNFMDFECTGRATCSQSLGSICTCNC